VEGRIKKLYENSRVLSPVNLRKIHIASSNAQTAHSLHSLHTLYVFIRVKLSTSPKCVTVHIIKSAQILANCKTCQWQQISWSKATTGCSTVVSY